MTSSPAVVVAVFLLCWLTGIVAVLVAHRSELRRLWRDPVFRRPVLVLESDDWGAGPLAQADALRSIADVLQRHQDSTRRTPSFNLALVLAVPDGDAIRTAEAYRRICLDAPMFSLVLAALRDGQARGVFALQLHGLEHYWPAAVMSSDEESVQRWRQSPAPATTEQLPSHLQSRWVDAKQLPSKPLPPKAVQDAVAEECATFARIFGSAPKVVVPPTFVWTLEIERAWAQHGLCCVVTPGWRYTLRGADGLPGGDEGPIVNGDRHGPLTYLVRNDYFEPARGRDALHALRALDVAAQEGRPCVLENHRDNFILDAQVCQRSLAELDHLCRDSLVQHPGLRFLSSWELARLLRDRDPQWLHLGLRDRVAYLWARLQHTGRLWKLVKLSGLGVIGAVLVRLFFPPHKRAIAP